MPPAIGVLLPTDPDELAALAYDYLEAVFSGWDRSRGDAMSQMVAAHARLCAAENETASEMSYEALRWLALWVDGLAPGLATSAQTTATVVAVDNLGYTVRDGDRFEIATSGDEGQVFVAVGDTTIPPLSTSTGVGEVVLIAETAGAAGSGLPEDSDVQPVDALAWIESVTLEELTTGGVDAQTDDEHLSQWIALRALSHDTPILATDAAALVKALIPGVGRTLPLDNYDPALGTFGHEKYNPIAATDLAGEPLGSGVKALAVALLEARRTWGFHTDVIDGTYSTVDVAVEFLTHVGFDVDAAEEVVIAALTTYLDPLVWSTSANSDGGEEWRALEKVYLDEVITLVNNVEPVDRLTSRKIGLVRPVTAAASTDLFSLTAHGYVAGSPATFRGLTGGAGITAEQEYFVIASGLTADLFRVSATLGGSTINITTDLTGGTVRSMQAADVILAQPAALTRPGVITAVGTAPA